MIITLSESKEYLRIDGEDEDVSLENMLSAAESICRDIARMDEQAFEGAGALPRQPFSTPWLISTSTGTRQTIIDDVPDTHADNDEIYGNRGAYLQGK